MPTLGFGLRIKHRMIDGKKSVVAVFRGTVIKAFHLPESVTEILYLLFFVHAKCNTLEGIFYRINPVLFLMGWVSSLYFL